MLCLQKVTYIFECRTVAVGSTQPVTAISTRNISLGVKTAGAWGRQILHLHVSIILKSESFKLQEPSGPVQARTAMFCFIYFECRLSAKLYYIKKLLANYQTEFRTLVVSLKDFPVWACTGP